MHVLSFDVGIKNLAYGLFCVTDNDSGSKSGIESGSGSGPHLGSECAAWRILDWNILPLAAEDETCKKVGLSELCTRLIDGLDHTFPPSDIIDLILIENQPVMKNPVMKSIQMMLYTYFHIRQVHAGSVGEVRLVSARTKNLWGMAAQLLGEAEQTQLDALQSHYQKNKKQSVAVVKALLQSKTRLDCSPELQAIFEKSKKKDDLADAFLQAWATLHPFRASQ